MEKKYYKSLEELRIAPEQFQSGEMLGDKKSLLQMEQELKQSSGPNRRDFLKLFGFTVASAAVAASCEQPVRKAIPFLIQPEEITPGKANYYASTFYDGNDYCSILVKVRDGRPIKIEGNTLSTVTGGGTSARTQASVLDLYDNTRYKAPLAQGQEYSWEQIDNEVPKKLSDIAARGGKIVVLSPTLISPSTKAAVDLFINRYPGTEHIKYDTTSASAILRANEVSFGRSFIPAYQFDRAEVIVSFDADFLGTWLSPVEFTKQYISKRKLHEGNKTMSRHIHFESGMSLTGSNADKRVVIKPSQQKTYVAQLLLALTGNAQDNPEIEKIAGELSSAKGKSLVVSNSQDTETQMMIIAINEILSNYGSTLLTDVHLKLKQADDSAMARLIDEMAQGKIEGIVLYDVNPSYDYPDREAWINGLQKTPLKITFNSSKNETSEMADYVCPDHHYLESWNDYEVKTGHYSLSQPAIRHIFNTRQAQESLLKWSGVDTDFRNFIQEHWKQNIFAADINSFVSLWNTCVHDGVYVTGKKETGIATINTSAALELASASSSANADDSIQLDLYYNISVGSGKHANNPWLQELPDPVTKVCWDNYAAVSQKLAEELGLEDESLVTINKLGPFPVLIQPGQESRTISIALGYGREKGGKSAVGVGVNAYPLVGFSNGARQLQSANIDVEKVNGKFRLARTQTHHSMEGRQIVRETTLAGYLENPKSGNEVRDEIKKHLKTIYPKKEYAGLHWGMAIDLNSCIGCNACVVACSAENNVPVVGKEQVLMAREMHWIRIDRYYTGDPVHPELVRQPVMCQHCDNAPCENVCPVAATTHSDEGINQMAYNRCIGTRYCNNNCPYKVRRFNFFDYTNADAIKGNLYDHEEMTVDLRRLVLNPDVTTRAKGVIEKCSFCIQRIQDKKLTAKIENRQLADGEVVTACAQACPAQAIVFGNLNDKESRVSKMFADERNYHVLEELHVLPSVGYLTKVKNTNV